MKFNKLWVSVIAVCCSLISTAYAQPREQDSDPYHLQLDERDFIALREFLKAKRKELEAQGLKGEVTMVGDVRFEWRHLKERKGDHNIRGRSVKQSIREYGRAISCNDFDVQLNLLFSYETKRSWATAEVRFDNGAGVGENSVGCIRDPRAYNGSGECNKVCLRAAYIGYNVYQSADSRFDIEIGRRNLYRIFDSEIQFDSRTDGILLYFDHTLKNHQKIYWQLYGFVVDETVNHFAWITEFGALDIGGRGLDFKYSLIDWRLYGRNRCDIRDPAGFKFLNSQFLLAYNFDPEWVGNRLKLYGAFLINHDGQKRRAFLGYDKNGHLRLGKHFPRKNLGWYAGFLLGEVISEGDWSVQIEYEVVQAFCMPEGDQNGIGRGNVLDQSITGLHRSGNTNFRGWWLEALYAITDELVINASIQWSKQDTRKIGGRHSYSQVRLETIYAF